MKTSKWVTGNDIPSQSSVEASRSFSSLKFLKSYLTISTLDHSNDPLSCRGFARNLRGLDLARYLFGSGNPKAVVNTASQ